MPTITSIPVDYQPSQAHAIWLFPEKHSIFGPAIQTWEWIEDFAYVCLECQTPNNHFHSICENCEAKDIWGGDKLGE